MRFLKQPSDGVINTPLAPVIISLKHEDAVVNVTLELKSKNAAVLRGRLNRITHNGRVMFDDLQIDQPGEYQLLASVVAPEITHVESVKFNITNTAVKKTRKQLEAGKRLEKRLTADEAKLHLLSSAEQVRTAKPIP